MLTPIKITEKMDEHQARAFKAVVAKMVDSGQIPASVGDVLQQTIACLTVPKPGETAFFVMIYPEPNLKVVRWLIRNSKRPRKALEIWALLMCNLKRHTGEITLTRDEISSEVGIRSSEVSQIMSELVRFNAIFSKRERIPGLRGPGKVVYYMNKHVAQVGGRATKEELSQIPEPGANEEG